MVVMAAAGLDAMAKQLIRDSLPKLVEADPSVRQGLEKFISRQIRDGSDGPELPSSRKFLARVLAAPAQQAEVIELYMQELTGGSLQSPDQLIRTASAIGVPPETFGVDLRTLKRIFGIRNKIIHELDMYLEGDRRKRNQRGKGDMISHANDLLKTAENLRDAVDKKLAEFS